MYIKRSVNKKAAIITTIVLTILIILFFFLSIRFRMSAEQKSKEYKHVLGTILDYECYEHEDDDDNEYYTYSVTVQYKADSEMITQVTDDIFNYKPYIDDNMDIMYNPNDAYDYYVAKVDWLSGGYYPYDFSGDGFLLTAFLCLTFWIMIVGLLLPWEKMAALGVGFSLFLLGIIGLVFTFILDNAGMLLLIIFAVPGVIIIYRTLFVPKDKLARDAAYAEYARLFIVRDIIYDYEDSGEPVALLAMVQSKSTEEYFSYTDTSCKFKTGEKYQLDIRLITDSTYVRQINGIDAVDISYIPDREFKPLSGALKWAFSAIT